MKTGKQIPVILKHLINYITFLQKTLKVTPDNIHYVNFLLKRCI
jgi:hypothetical protein